MLITSNFNRNNLKYISFQKYKIQKRTIATLVSSSSKIQGTYLTLPIKITMSTRFMSKWKALSKALGYAPKLLKALKTKTLEVVTALETKGQKSSLQNMPKTPVFNSMQDNLPTPKLNELLQEKFDVINPNATPTDKNIITNQVIKILKIQTLPHVTDTIEETLMPVTNDLLIVNENPYKDQLSGIVSMSDLDRSKLLGDPEYLKKFAQIFFFEHTKILHYVFKAKLKDANIFDIIAKSYSLYHTNDMLQRDHISFQIYTNKFPSMCQHILTLLLPKKNFSIDILQNQYGHLVDTSYQKEINILTLIEFYTFCGVVKEFILDKDFLGHIRAIDFKSPLLDDADLFKTIGSENQTSQKYSDFFIYFLKYHKDFIEVIKIYRDVKMDYKGPLTGHITIRPYLTTNFFSAKKYMNDYTTHLKEKLIYIKNVKNKSFFLKKFNKLKDIQDTTNKANFKENILEFTGILTELTFNEKFIEEGVNITIAGDLEYSDDYQLEEILDKVQKDEELMELFRDVLDVVYPRSNYCDKIAWFKYYDFVLEINKRYGPTSTKEQIANNFKENFIEFCNQNNIIDE